MDRPFKREINGVTTDLVEIAEEDAVDIVNLRNNKTLNKFLFQSTLTIESQKEWIRGNTNKHDAVNFKVLDKKGDFKGTISIYSVIEERGEFGRYIITNPLQAIEAEYLLLKFCFEKMNLKAIYCQTNILNTNVWKQHLKFGFIDRGVSDTVVGSNSEVIVKAVIQEIQREQYLAFDYSRIFRLINAINRDL